MNTLKLSGELSAAKTSCMRDSYYIFLETTIQLDDVVKMCWTSAM